MNGLTGCLTTAVSPNHVRPRRGPKMADSKPICSVEECNKPTRARGLCVAHYKRWERHGCPTKGGTPMGARPKWIEENKGHLGNECLIWPYSRTEHGYGQIKIRGRSTLASHAMCVAAHGDPPKIGMQAAHSCGNGHLGCVNPRHLRWATRKENMADAKIHGTWVHGERQGGSKLTRKQVLRIRASNGPHQHIAAQYGIARQTVAKIKLGRIWAWLE